MKYIQIWINILIQELQKKKAWNKLFEEYKKEYPELAKEYAKWM